MAAGSSLLKRLFSLIWRTIDGVRRLIVNLLFLGFIIIFAIAISGDEQPKIEVGSALVVNFNGPIVDQKQRVDPLEAAFKNSSSNQQTGELLLADLLNTIDEAAQDKHIAAIVLDLNKLTNTSISKLKAVGDALNRFKLTGKQVIAKADWYSQNQYYLASFADTIYLNHQGGVAIEGLSRYRQYYRSALDKFNIKAHVFRVGTFKSAVEPFLRDDMSEEAKEANLSLMDDLWHDYSTQINKNRTINNKPLLLSANEYINQLNIAEGSSAQMALNLNWVDQLVSDEEFRLAMLNIFGESVQKNKFKQVSFSDYAQQLSPSAPDLTNNIGIVVAKGTIQMGSQPAGQIGGKSTAELLRKARFDESIKAVVLRVDSPGGSAFASEEIRQEVIALKAANKPVVVSMGSYAASGGYWISASADHIFATPTTLTGSIGIFGMITTFEDSLEYIGINTDGVATSPLAGVSATKGLNPTLTAIIQRHVERGYHDFISLVAKEREMSLAQVNAIAQGRVWSGRRAVTLGLVDELGDMDEAIAKAAQLAELTTFKQKLIEHELSTKELFMQELFSTAADYLPMASSNNLLLKLANQWNLEVDKLSTLDDPKGLYLYCETCL